MRCYLRSNRDLGTYSNRQIGQGAPPTSTDRGDALVFGTEAINCSGIRIGERTGEVQVQVQGSRFNAGGTLLPTE
jgi:hypothetical protein